MGVPNIFSGIIEGMICYVALAVLSWFLLWAWLKSRTRRCNSANGESGLTLARDLKSILDLKDLEIEVAGAFKRLFFPFLQDSEQKIFLSPGIQHDCSLWTAFQLSVRFLRIKQLKEMLRLRRKFLLPIEFVMIAIGFATFQAVRPIPGLDVAACICLLICGVLSMFLLKLLSHEEKSNETALGLLIERGSFDENNAECIDTMHRYNKMSGFFGKHFIFGVAGLFFVAGLRFIA